MIGCLLNWDWVPFFAQTWALAPKLSPFGAYWFCLCFCSFVLLESGHFYAIICKHVIITWLPDHLQCAARLPQDQGLLLVPWKWNHRSIWNPFVSLDWTICLRKVMVMVSAWFKKMRAASCLAWTQTLLWQVFVLIAPAGFFFWYVVFPLFSLRVVFLLFLIQLKACLVLCLRGHSCRWRAVCSSISLANLSSWWALATRGRTSSRCSIPCIIFHCSWC